MFSFHNAWFFVRKLGKYQRLQGMLDLRFLLPEELSEVSTEALRAQRPERCGQAPQAPGFWHPPWETQ